MRLKELTASIRTRLTGDTGAGGLFAPGAQLLQAVRWGQVPNLTEFTTYPYCVLSFDAGAIEADSGFDHDGAIFSWTATVYGSAEVDGSMVAVMDASDRIWERLNRWEPTAPTGWTAAGKALWTGTNDVSDLPQVYAITQTFDVRLFNAV